MKKASFVIAIIGVIFVASGLSVNAQADVSFYDVRSDHINYDAIKYARDNNIVAGYADGSFQAGSKINRAEFTKIIVEAVYLDEALGSDCFPDVHAEWFAKYVCSAKRKGVIGGYPDGSFKPSKNVSFVEAAKIIVLSFGNQVQRDELWYKPFVENLGSQGAIPTSVDLFAKEITRGEMVEMIYRLRAKEKSKASLGYESLSEINKIMEGAESESVKKHRRLSIIESIEQGEEPVYGESQNSDSSDFDSSVSDESETAPLAEEINQENEGGEVGAGCSGGLISFDYPPVNLDKILYIEPMGSMHGEHVAPIDHQYYQNFNNTEPNIEVYAPAAGVITNMQHMGSFRGDSQNEPMDDYRVVIKHTCTISTVFIHIDVLADRIMEVAPDFGEYTYVNLPVEAGEVLGWYTSNVDFNVIDEDVNINLIDPHSYGNAPDRIHIKDPFEYFEQPIRNQLISKSLRRVKPEGGTIDYDVDGALVGTWFGENTNGWGGVSQERYWADHLAISYDSIDTEHVKFSIGTYEGKARQFCIKGNGLDPGAVSVATGLLKFELVDCRLFSGNREWDYRSFVSNLKVKNYDQVEGVVWLEMVGERRLKLEVFPGKTLEEVGGFSDELKFYVR